MEALKLPEPIRMATPEEVEAIAKTSDLTQFTTVLKWRGHTAVIRSITELDPVLFEPNSNLRERAMFIWGIENIMRSTGLKGYYFNIAVNDEEWRTNIEHWGAECVSSQPEFRFKKVL